MLREGLIFHPYLNIIERITDGHKFNSAAARELYRKQSCPLGYGMCAV